MNEAFPPGRHRSLSWGVCVVVVEGEGGGCSGMYPEGLWEGRLTGQAWEWGVDGVVGWALGWALGRG